MGSFRYFTPCLMAVSAVKPQLRSHGSPCFSPRQRSSLTEADGHSSYCAELCLKRTWRQSPPPESQGKLALDPTAGTGPVYFSLYLFIFNSGGFFFFFRQTRDQRLDSSTASSYFSASVYFWTRKRPSLHITHRKTDYRSVLVWVHFCLWLGFLVHP